MSVPEYIHDCYCDLTGSDHIKDKCIALQRCIFVTPVHPKTVYQTRAKSVVIGALLDYFRGARIRDLTKKWSVSKGYIYKKLALADIPRRPSYLNTANYKKGQAPKVQISKRKLIPYAGKEDFDD